MIPEQVSALIALVAFVDKVSSWPLGTVFFLVIVGPWLLALILAYSARKRFEVVVRMYENNVRLLERNQELAGDLKEIIIMNTQAMAQLTAAIDGSRNPRLLHQGGDG